jgi:hypothetical protein
MAPESINTIPITLTAIRMRPMFCIQPGTLIRLAVTAGTTEGADSDGGDPEELTAAGTCWLISE